jgi:hypothetical protein
VKLIIHYSSSSTETSKPTAASINAFMLKVLTHGDKLTLLYVFFIIKNQLSALL